MKAETKRRAAGLAGLVLLLAAVQLARFGLKSAAFLFLERTPVKDRLAFALAMAMLTAALLAAAKRRGIKLSIFPERFGVVYVAATVLFAALLTATPFLTGAADAVSVLLMLYSAVLTPVE